MTLNYVPRVTQLDAVRLDQQVVDLFKQQLFEATKYFEPGFLQPVLPELELFLQTWIFNYSVRNKKLTFGQEMLSLFYKKENFSHSKLYWYYGYTVGLKYLKDRAIYSLTSNTKVQSFVHSLETFQLVADMINFLSFIQSGKYPTLIDFILGLEVSADKVTREDLSDLSWTRELLWHNFIELIGTVLSLMNLFGVKRRLSTILKFVWWRNEVRHSTNKPAVMNINTVCAFCNNKPILPHTMGCSHIFCYYCVTANKMADKDFCCPQCMNSKGEIVRYIS